MSSRLVSKDMTIRVALYTALAVLIPAAALAQASPGAATRQRPAAPSLPVHLVLAATGNEARFIVRETLAGASLPNDAICATKSITGEIKLGPDGKVDTATSMITVQMATLTSDQARRDGWIKRNTLKTDSFPTATLVITELQGFPTVLPTSGTISFRLIGDFTVHGVTKPWTWDVTLTANGSEFTGRATTHLKFGDFGMEQPRVMVVLSVVDDVKLEYDFHFVKSPTN